MTLRDNYRNLGAMERSRRPDGQWNVWQYRFLFSGDNVPRWVLIDVVGPL